LRASRNFAGTFFVGAASSRSGRALKAYRIDAASVVAPNSTVSTSSRRNLRTSG
jgi:hypothetical protein